MMNNAERGHRHLRTVKHLPRGDMALYANDVSLQRVLVRVNHLNHVYYISGKMWSSSNLVIVSFLQHQF